MENQNIIKAYYDMKAEFQWSYGKISRFFKELIENKRIMGTKCPKCGVVFCPPTSDCPKCWVPTEWIEIGPQGTLLTFTVIHMPNSWSKRPAPYTLGLVKLDGADTGLLHYIDSTDKEILKKGPRVEAVFADERKGYVTDIDCFRLI